ncbi:cell division control protein 14 [Savitreella phatthalungensis]
MTSQMIEFLQDRLYLSAFDSPPPKERHPQLRFFTVDDLLVYNAFHHDFGPLHIGHLYRFAIILHEILSDPDMSSKPIVFYSRTNSRARANAACILACYMVLVQNWPPHLAIAPLAEADPPFMPFRDAGYSQADYTLSIQDFVYGIWRAKEAGIVDIKTFDLEEYEYYERVDKGDFNWICPRFIAFASPIQPGYTTKPNPFTSKKSTIITPTFTHVLDYFKGNKVGMVVRLNSHLYDKAQFEKIGIEHVDMFFEDGTCPELDIVKDFIGLVDEMAEADKVVAVHCKAGLGRTGCLIGAYLIYKHRFTANEVISFMRLMRPGMVVGPQQHWLHINQHHFTDWRYHGVPRRNAHKASPFSTPPRAILGDLHENTTEAKVHEKGEAAGPLPAPTPGQPRKAPSPRRVASKPPRIASLAGTTTTTSASENSENIEDELLAASSVVDDLVSVSVSPSRKSSMYGDLGSARKVSSPRSTRKSSREQLPNNGGSGAPSSRTVSTGSVTNGGVRKVSAKMLKGRV